MFGEAFGKLIVVEGIDGSGTTTQSRLLVDWLIEHERRAILTCEPSTGPIGHLLRDVLAGRVVMRRADASTAAVGNNVIALLFAADRLDHLDSEIRPVLSSGIDVVSDRYYHSSLTYQGLEGDLEWIRALNSHARAPDVTYILSVPAAEAAARRHRVRAFEDLYEKQEFQERLEQAYLRLPSILPGEDIVVLDGSVDVPAVHLGITEDLKRRFGWR